MRELTRDSIAESLERLLAVKGNECYVSPFGPGGDCQYVHTSPDGPEPGCMWGQVLVDHEYNYGVLEAHEGNSIGGLMRDGICRVYDGRVRLAAECSQEVQDAGHPYAHAIRVYFEVLDNGTRSTFCV